MAETPTIIQISLLDSSGDSWHRMRWPARQLSGHTGWRVLNVDFRAEERFAWGEEADLLVLLHCGDRHLLPLIQKRRRLGKATLVEINDNFYEPQEWNPARQWWDSLEQWKTYQQMMSLADGVIVSGEGLRDLLLPEVGAEKIFILENHFPEPLTSFDEVYDKPSDRLIIGWAGSAGHMVDLLSVRDVLADMLTQHDDLFIHLMGDATIPEFLGIDSRRLLFVPFGSIQEYFGFWKDVHIALIPLLDSPYNRCRSDIKALETSAAATAPVVQDSLTYKEFIEKSGCLTFSKPDELKAHLSQLARERALIRPLAEKAYRYVRERRVLSERSERVELYKRFLPKRLSDYDWPFLNGFSEVLGRSEVSSSSRRQLQEFQNLWNRGERSKASKMLQAALEENPFAGDLAYAEVQALALTQPQKLQGRLLVHLRNFSEDLRFDCFQIRLETDSEKKRELWSKLVEKLQTWKPSHRELHEKLMVSFFLKEILSVSLGVKIVQGVYDLFPANLQLLLALSKAQEECGKIREAQRNFSVLLERLELLGSNSEFFEKLEAFRTPILKEFSARSLPRVEGQRAN